MASILSALFAPLRPLFFSAEDTATTSSTEGAVAMNYFSGMQKDFKPPLIANDNAFLGDIATSEKNDAKSPISCGLYRLEKGLNVPSFTIQSLSSAIPLSFA